MASQDYVSFDEGRACGYLSVRGRPVAGWAPWQNICYVDNVAIRSIAFNILSSNCPAGPTNGIPDLSSAPGASIIIKSGLTAPDPKTRFFAVNFNGQPSNLEIAALIRRLHCLLNLSQFGTTLLEKSSVEATTSVIPLAVLVVGVEECGAGLS